MEIIENYTKSQVEVIEHERIETIAGIKADLKKMLVFIFSYQVCYI